MSKILFIADNPIGSSYRGAESCDAIIYAELKPDFQTCQEFNQNPHLADKYIVSNFASLSHDSQDILISRGNVVHISHDFLFVGSRNPAQYADFKVEPDHLINVEFLKSAKIFCQSSFQESIFKLNGFENTESWGGNLWTDEIIEFCVSKESSPKNGRAAIISGDYKGERSSADLCKKLNIPFDIIGNMEYLEFLNTLKDYSCYVFAPSYTIESYCRVLTEASMMRVLPIVPGWCGAIGEDLYKFNGRELGVKLKEKRKQIISLLSRS
jgi:hypothetical protein